MKFKIGENVRLKDKLTLMSIIQNDVFTKSFVTNFILEYAGSVATIKDHIKKWEGDMYELILKDGVTYWVSEKCLISLLPEINYFFTEELKQWQWLHLE